MFNKTNSNLFFSLMVLVCLAIGLYSCEQSEDINPQTDEKITSIFKQHLEDNTQRFVAEDQGNGKYSVTGEQGTRINIDNALVNASGERVRGDVDVVLIEIYTVADMVMNRKQTLADYGGNLEILESGGEVFVKVYQNGEELFADGKGDMRILLPTENTGGAKEGMELFYGEEVGEQIIWKPTGQAVKVASTEGRAPDDYIVLIQDILGWINVDVIYKAGGEAVKCVELKITCEEICGGEEPMSTTVAMHIANINSAFELTLDPATGYYKYCGDQGPLAIGGLTVTFIVVIQCEDGSMYSSFATVTINPGNHFQTVNCDDIHETSPDQLVEDLNGLL